jgi:hypothetical protein
LKREDTSGKQLERIKKYAQRTQYDADSDICSYKCYKTKKGFESALNYEIMKVEEECEARKKFKREDRDDTEDEEEFIILEYRPDPLTMINTPIQDDLVPVESKHVIKHYRIFHDDN